MPFPTLRQRLLFLFFTLLTTHGLSAFSQEEGGRIGLPAEPQSIRFRWLAEGTLKHSALLLPIRLPNCSETFYLQFDLGAPATLFYREAVQGILVRYPAALDTAGGRLSLRDARLDRSAFSVEGAALRNYAGSGINWKKRIRIIGTAGSDLLSGRAVLLDFPAQRLKLNVDSTVTGATPVHPLLYLQGRILLPARIGGQQKLLVYDSGSSAFSLLTDSASAVKMARPGAADQQHASRSWDVTLTAHSFASSDSIGLGGKMLPLRQVSYISGTSEAQVQSMARFGIGGMAGNVLFLKQRLYLDLKRKKFTLLP
ncbi:hypothetical protein [Flaviaesturariibacter aridisoli]|uniref:Aspartyl protease n=1 Tax=Flaviaesturariibacter aridisoli TaxID=2545761 RepID=A0A4R4EAI1_9BACT|nr:hypothetical protein [Flaviaesturariibacter aridisoli]TCZ74888.1 hypothetical protein E0486_00865 [Flaviaesturariibacter aridisoli]